MKFKHTLYIAFAVAIVATGCRKYVEIPQEQQRVLQNTSDYQALLQNSTYFDRTYTYPLYAGDDIGADTVLWQNGLNNSTNGFAYTWAEKLVNSTAEDNDWYNMYYGIYLCNLVVVNVMESKGGTDAEKHKAYASALVHRALYYHILVNMYAKQYDASTAATDLGVPLRLDDLITGDLKRATVQRVYEQILSDLNTAVADLALPDLPEFTTNASKAAAYAVLARVYLDMRNFAKAREAADNALKLQSTLLDLNNYVASATSFPQKHVDPELILSKTASFANLPLSPSLLSLFEDGTDLRYQVYTKKGDEVFLPYLTRVYTKNRIAGQAIISGPTVPEMMLIKAECEARAGNGGDAVDILNTLRKKRFKPADYEDLTAASAEEAFQLVLRERKMELMCRGFRWFDQRRLAKDGLTPTVTRKFMGTTYTLAPESNRYVFPIADKYILLNPEIEQNPR